ncbi:glycosyltransferase family 4 protein [Sorangium sp. So ce124]|uniref:glycosyltransferase family 4 protein n=1 Tax=Sorangium sp. So ce124 TaxID=3133280 RepID=UPI003F642479
MLLLPAANRRSAAYSPIPTVAMVHALAQIHVPGKFDALRTAYLRVLIGRVVGRADELIEISEATRRDLVGMLRRPSGSVRVVPNGVDYERITLPVGDDPRVRAARRRFGLHKPYLLYLARIEYAGKDHLHLLRAFQRSRASSTHLLVLAGADWGALPLIIEEVVRLGLGNRTMLLGYVSDSLESRLVAGADGVLMVGLHEGFGLPALEALSAGRPLAIARIGALPEVTGDLAASCDPSHEPSIAVTMDRLVEDETLRERARREGPGHARARSWEATAHGWLDACQATLSRRSTTASHDAMIE